MWNPENNCQRPMLRILSSVSLRVLWFQVLHSSLSSILSILSFQGHTHSLWGFPGWESNWSCSCQLTPQPQQREIWATSATYYTQGNTQSLTHWVRPGIKPVSSWILVRFITIKPQWKLLLKASLCRKLTETNYTLKVGWFYTFTHICFSTLLVSLMLFAQCVLN